MVRWIAAIVLLPIVCWSQPLEFQLQPEAFPVTINGWQPYCPWAGGTNSTTPELADIDADGDLDFFTGSNYNYYHFFQNVGTASTPDFNYVSYNFDSLYPVCPGSAYWSDLDFKDMDGDGDLDALICNGIIGLAWNQGTPQQRDFAPPDTLFTTAGGYLVATRFAAADIDGDGDYDIIAGTWYAGGLTLYQNLGTPQQPQFVQVTSNWQNISIPEEKADPCFGDLDGDGDLDLLVGTHAGTVRYYRNDGNATSPQMVLVDSNYLGLDVQEDASPELADIDGDGDLDLFVGREPAFGQTITQGDVYFYRNEGTPQAPNFTYVTSNYLTWDNGQWCTPRLVDIDGDGDPDLFSNIGQHLLFYRNQGSPQTPQFVYETDSFPGVTVFDLDPWFVDIDGDGDYDIIAGESSIPNPPGLHLFLNRGSPQIPNFVHVTDDLVPGVFSQFSVHLSPATADIDGDGDQDLFVSDNEGYFYFIENTGTAQQPQFQLITNNWQGIVDNYMAHRKFCFYDMDGDGDLDLFYEGMELQSGTWKKTLRFYRNNGTAQNPVMQLENPDLFPELMIWQAAPFVVDMDQDGRGDLFVGDTWGGIRYFHNIGGSFVNPNPKRPEGPPERMITVLPNPGNSTIVASFELRVPSQISFRVYDITGRIVGELASGYQMPGTYRYTWQARNSGVFLFRLEAGSRVEVEKAVVVK